MSQLDDFLPPVAILLISSDYQWYGVLQKALRPLANMSIAENEENGLSTIRRNLQSGQKYDVIVIDTVTTSNKSPTLIKRIHELNEDAKVVVVTIAPTWRQAKEAFHMGAIDYIRKSLDENELLSAFQEVLRKKLPPFAFT